MEDRGPVMGSSEETAIGSVQGEQGASKEEIPPPTGTLFVMIVYLAILMAMWWAMYVGLLGS